MVYALVLLYGIIYSCVASDRVSIELANAFVGRVAKHSDIPGLAVGVVKNGKIVFAKGYGVLSHGKQDPVSPHSLFQMGSCTKTFIAMGLAHFVSLEGSDVTWETNVHTITKGKFNASISYLTQNINIGDLLAHRTGYGSHDGDMVWALGGVASERELVEQRVPFLRPAKSLRETFMYSNIGYEIATVTLEVLAGEPWYIFVRRTFLDPLGMSETVLGLPDVKGHQMRSNLSRGHFGTFGPAYTRKSGPSIASFDLLDASTPSIFPAFDDGYFGAGSAVTSVLDYCKWMVHLLKERTDKAVAQSETAQMIVPHIWAETFMGFPVDDVGNALGAGFGFDLVGGLFHGQPFFTKGGDTLFHKTRTGFLPESDVAAVVFANMQSVTSEKVCSGIRNALLELFTGVSMSIVEENWLKIEAAINEIEQQFEGAKTIPNTIPLLNGQNVTIAVKNNSALTLPQMEQVFNATQISGLPPPGLLQEHAGEFHSRYGGILRVKTTSDGRLSAHYGAVNGLLSFYGVAPSSAAQIYLCPNASLHTALFGSMVEMIYTKSSGTWQLGDLVFSRNIRSVSNLIEPLQKMKSFSSPYLPSALDFNHFPAADISFVQTTTHDLHDELLIV